ncbi:MAG: alpha/beta hydrolase [Mangrovibacterium sp.]
MMKFLTIISVNILLFGLSGFAQDSIQAVYKTVGSTDLYLKVFFPKEYNTHTSYPSVVFFFGGGWKGGSNKQFEPHARYFSDRGMICFLPDYRVKNRHGTTPIESLKDAKSVIRFIRRRAEYFHIDTAKIIVSGDSAGGHLAAATALIKMFNEANEDSSVSCIPNALVLFNPVIDNGPGGYGYERIGNKYKDFSPLHNIVKGAPPTIFFLGTMDKIIPVETAKYYKTMMEKVGSRCDLHLYESEGHGFFKFKPEYYKETVFEMDRFLISLGYLNGEPTINNDK